MHQTGQRAELSEEKHMGSAAPASYTRVDYGFFFLSKVFFLGW